MKILRLMFAVSVLSGCMHAEEPQKHKQPALKPTMVKSEVFQKHYGEIGEMHTMKYASFVGIEDGVAILKVGKMNVITNKFHAKHIGVKLADLDPKLRAEIEKLDK